MNNTLRSSIILIVAACLSLPVFAQQRNREMWLKEIREHKHTFLIEQLALTQEQQNEFLPMYDEMERELNELDSKTRELAKQINENETASDLEVENAARTIFEHKRAEGQIEMTYFEKFKTVLSPRQLLKLKATERKFTRRLYKHHRRMRRNNTE